MGAGTSRAALQNQSDTYGSLKLDKKQQTNLVILSDLITMVVEKNNLFNLSDLLSSSGGCNKLLILLESKLKQEFTSLRFPDPDQLSTLSVVDFLPLKEYEYYQKTPAREALCKNFAFFIVRFTTLLSALVASVAFQPNIATEIINNLDISSSTPSALPSLPFTSVVGNPIQGDIIQFLGPPNNFYRVPNDSRSLYYFKDESKVPIFVLDASTGLVYRVDQPQTPVLGITIRLNDGRFFEPTPWVFNPPYRSSTYTSIPPPPIDLLAGKIPKNPMDIPIGTLDEVTHTPVEVNQKIVRIQENGKYYYYDEDEWRKYMSIQIQMRKPIVNFGALGTTPLSSSNIDLGVARLVPTLGGRRKGTRVARRRKQGRMTKKRSGRSRIGGAGPEFLVQFYNVLSCPSVQPTQYMQPVDLKKPCLHGPQFLMDERGNTWEKSAEPGAFPQKLPFNERVAEIFKTVTDTVVLKSDPLGNKTEAIEMFRRLNTLDPETYTQFQTIQHLIMGKDTSNHTLTSPAFYRALLLITSVQRNIEGKEDINTLFCDDKWTGRMTSIVPYALLQALYYDIAPTTESPGNISSQAKTELASVSASFRTNSIAKTYDVAPAQQGMPEPANTLSQLQFIPPSKIANIFCSKEPSGFRTTNVPNQMIILKNTYNTLQQMYNKHLENVVQLIRKVLSLQQGEFQKAKRIALRPIFVTNPDGAQRALEGFIAEGRALLAKHYLDVETAYKAALISIQKLGEGTDV